MKLSAVLITTLALASVAIGFPHRPIGEDFHQERLDRFLNLLPEDLRAEIEDPIRTAIANGERPQIPAEIRDQIREHMSGLKEQHQHKLDRFLSILPEELRQEVQAVLDQSAANGEFPRAPEELRNKIRDHFAAVKDERKQHLDKFKSLLSEELRAEVEELLRVPLVDGQRPQASEELREKIREHFRNLKEVRRERLDRFMSMLPEELRQEVQAVLEQSAANGEFPRAPEELRNKIRDHFAAVKDERKQHLDKFQSLLSEELRAEVEELLRVPLVDGQRPQASEELREKIRDHFHNLKEVRRERLDRFMSMLPEDLRQEVQVVVNQALINGERPHAPEELREKIREHFGQMKEAHRDQLEVVLNYLPKEIRDRIEREVKQFVVGHGMVPRFSPELMQMLREYLDRLLPQELKEKIFAEVHQAIETGVFPVLSEDLREKIRQFMELLTRPQLF